MPSKFGIQVFGDPFAISGLATNCREIILSFLKNGHDVSLSITNPEKHRTDKFPEANLIKKAINNKKQKIGLYFGVPDFWNIECNINIGMLFCEADRIPMHWAEKCNKMTAIIVPTNFCKQSLVNSQVNVPIYVCVCGYTNISHEKDKKESRKIFGVSNDEFVFLSIGQWHYRKGFDVLLRAFWSEFSKDEKVRLIIKTYEADFSESTKNRILDEISELKRKHYYYNPITGENKIQDFPCVTLVLDELSNSDLSSLYAMSDAFALTSRGEGLGRPYLEAASFSLPILATNFGGQSDFLTEENSYLVHNSLEPCIGMNAWWYPIYCNIASPDIKMASKMMRDMFISKTHKKVDKTIIEKYSYENSFKDYLNVINMVANG